MANDDQSSPPRRNTPREIEIKLRVPDHAATRKVLLARGAGFIERVLETNQFFDRPGGDLRAAGCGLRLRLLQREGQSACAALLTWKGPSRSSVMHNRPSLDLTAAPAELAESFVKALGFVPTVAFEKRRESWAIQPSGELGGSQAAQLHACRVELDELPELGCFVEIEGPDERAVLSVRRRLGLEGVANEPTTYLAMVSEYLRAHSVPDTALRFPR